MEEVNVSRMTVTDWASNKQPGEKIKQFSSRYMFNAQSRMIRHPFSGGCKCPDLAASLCVNINTDNARKRQMYDFRTRQPSA